MSQKWMFLLTLLAVLSLALLPFATVQAQDRGLPQRMTTSASYRPAMRLQEFDNSTMQNNSNAQDLVASALNWQQVNAGGFGNPKNEAAISLAVFNNQLYSGAGNWSGAGASIWRTSDSSNWSPVMTGGFGFPANNAAIASMIAFKDQLYAGAGWGGLPHSPLGQLWRSPDGTTWSQITGNGMGVSSGVIYSFTIYADALYALTCVNGSTQIWRSTTGDSSSWNTVVNGGFNGCANSLKVFNGFLYTAVFDGGTSIKIWRSATGDAGSWIQLNTSGLPISIDGVGGMAVYDGYLFVGIRGTSAMAELWKSSDGFTWTSVTTNGFGDFHNWELPTLYVFNDMLYAGLNNDTTGVEVWWFDGTLWSQANQDGFGDFNNGMMYTNETVAFNNSLYTATSNWVPTGLEIWKLIGPQVVSVNRVNTNPTTAASVDFTVTFSEFVTGVDANAPFDDFALVTDGVTAASITNVSGSGKNYTVTIDTGDGVGTIHLNIVDNNTILDAANNPLGGPNLGDGDFAAGETYTIMPNVNITIGGQSRGNYRIPASDELRVNYANLDNGPVKVESTTGTPIVTALRDLWWNGSAYTSSIQLMGLPQNLLSDTYVFPSYNNVNLNDQLRFGNVGNADTTVTVTIGGVVRGTYPLHPNERQKANYAGLDSGPVIVKSSNGVPIIASIRDAWIVNGTTTSFSQLMGLPQSQLSDTYIFPSYNNVSLSDQLRFGNVGNAPTTVTVTIGGVVKGTYDLLPNQRDKATYAGLDSGPVIVKSSNGVPIIASLREAWLNNGVTTSYFQMMGLPQSQLSDKYVFPAYDNVSLSGQLRFGIVGNTSTTVTVTIGGVVKGSYDLAPNQRQKVSYADLDKGPVVVQSSNGVPIIVALRDAWLVDGVTTSFSQLMGLPGGQLSPTYVFPSYNNATYDNQLRIGVP